MTVPTPRDAQHAAMMINAVNSTARLLGLDQSTYNETPVLTAERAEATQHVVQRWFNARGNDDGPVLYKPGHEGPMWVLSYEGDYNWTIRICDDMRGMWPDGVFAEPVSGWCLGLYPEG